MYKRFKSSKPDPRIFILQIILISIFSFSFDNWSGMLSLFLFVDILVWIFLNGKISFKFFLNYSSIFVVYQILQNIYIPIMSFLIPMFLMVIIRTMPIYMMCVIFVRITPMNELMDVLRKLHIPMVILIPMAVMYRYIPTLFLEFKYVHNSLSMRGLNSSIWMILSNPIRNIEYFIVPLLFRSEKITEELTAATLCKGLSIEKGRTCCVDTKLELVDYMYLFFYLIVLLGLIYINKNLNLF